MTIATNKDMRKRKGKSTQRGADASRRTATVPGRRRKSLRFAAAGFVVLAMILIGVSVYRAQAAKSPDVPDSAVVATIDGEPVTAAEFRGKQSTKRAGVYDYFQQTYRLADTPDFWASAYGGERTVDKLRADTLAAIVEDKVQLRLAKREGIVQDIGYGSFLKQWEAENKRRAQTLKKGGLVYGPARLEASFYYDTWLTDNVERLKEKLAARDVIGDAQLNAYYEAHLADYTGQAAVKASLISIACGADDCGAGGAAYKQLERARDDWAGGEDWTKLQRRYGGDGAMAFASRTFDADSAKADTMVNPLLLQAAQALKPNEVSGIVAENGALYAVKALSVDRPKAVPLSEVGGQIRKQLADEAYAQRIEEAVKQAKIVIDHGAYDRLEAE
ncbi:hypothetical protein GXP70_26125 [Paenibacillus lycopersici]|uniref:PpiC domain-containing protein n=1 Tax=Paenibacillus lycopersici TaxID=2704462 RepID=A0A6C0G3L2_9BACL|nr:peptidyl-prolyl cis-trans isomerase [Paenibacillus lycopersici]QHT63102.1 hypothetical protein GXP70_26125 [Paenibacillus lycopersici]